MNKQDGYANWFPRAIVLLHLSEGLVKSINLLSTNWYGKIYARQT